jgi:hypothetical protein
MLSAFDAARTAVRFRRSALNLTLDCARGIEASSFPRRIGLFITNR